MMELTDLQELGLNKNESQVYLTLLKLGEAPANEIIKITGFHRNIVYDNLERLIEKGLVVFVNIQKKRIFRPSKATALMEMIKNKEDKLLSERKKAQQLTREVQNYLSKSDLKFKTTIYQGTKAIKEILYEILDQKEYWGIGISNASVEILGETFWKNYVQKINHYQLKENLLLNNDFKNTVSINLPKSTSIRYLPEQVNLITEILVFDDKVAIIIYTNPPIATVIENKDAVKSFKNYFRILWKISK